MTAMCDVAFLLLTFFILTTKFRPQEAVNIDIPASTAQIPIPEKDIMMFQIAPDGRIFFGLDDQNTRLKLLDRLAATYELTFSQEQKDAFRLIESWGVDIRTLPDYLNMDPTERAAFNQPGLNIEYLQYRAEGTCFVRLSGVVIDADPCPINDKAMFRLETEPKIEWWIHVVLPDNSVGWLLVTDSRVKLVDREF